jgi:hypothetical protein
MCEVRGKVVVWGQVGERKGGRVGRRELGSIATFCVCIHIRLYEHTCTLIHTYL